MGKPGRGHARSSRAEFIGARKRTQGTETSKYLEERKSTETPSVAASEGGSAQTSQETRSWKQETRARAGSAKVYAAILVLFLVL